MLMNSGIFTSLLHNAALLMALIVIYDMVSSRYRLPYWPQQFVTGVMLGVMGLGVMFAPLEIQPGIVFDTRSILLCLSGLFFGTIPTLIAMLLTAAYRLLQGGAAAVVGVLVILASGSIGIAWRQWCKPSLETISWRKLISRREKKRRR